MYRISGFQDSSYLLPLSMYVLLGDFCTLYKLYLRCAGEILISAVYPSFTILGLGHDSVSYSLPTIPEQLREVTDQTATTLPSLRRSKLPEMTGRPRFRP